MIGEFSFSQEPSVKSQRGFFGGGVLRLSRRVRLYFNSWSVNSSFPTFANEQLKYGYSLYQVFPEYSQRYIILSPFQFSRDLAGELYPFSMTRISVSENEVNGFLEWDGDETRLSTGYGYRDGVDDRMRSHIGYFSVFHNGEKTKYWGKIEMDRNFDRERQQKDSRTEQLLLGGRQRLFSTSRGSFYLQMDYRGEVFDDLLELNPSTLHHYFTFLGEFLTEEEGVFAGYRREILTSREDNSTLLDRNIYEAGVRKHIFKGLFVDSRIREEKASQGGVSSDVQMVSLGGGIESKRIRVMGRYEFQINKGDSQERKRQLWSLFVFGTPIKGMNLSLRYFRRKGMDGALVPSSESSEEELSFRLLWRPFRFLSLYSQWRYDTNIELYPPLDRTKSNTLASIQGLKISFSRKLEFLANYKMLRVWGPIENKKQSASAELGYLFFKHFRAGLGMEVIDFEDKFDPAGNYHSTVGYFKLIALY